MSWVALNCPQCSAPLPRVAIWRSVKCPACGALITRTESVVTRDSFRHALLRSRDGGGVFAGAIMCGGRSYSLMQRVCIGDSSEVYLAQRLGSLPLLVTVKLTSLSAVKVKYHREAQNLRELREIQAGAASVFVAQRLPEVVAQGPVLDDGKEALILRYPAGYWGSLAALCERFPRGIDPRHAVWIWRRMLDTLHFIHAQSWCHGDVRPDHALVNPEDHGILLIGWAAAKKNATEMEQAGDLMRSARVVVVLLSGEKGAGSIPVHVPRILADLITRASEDEGFCLAQKAQGLDALLRKTAQEAFGPPAFVPLIL